MTEPIRYRIIPKSPEAHLFEVSCTVADPNPEGQCFALPAWIPGSYLVRDFARHIVSIRAHRGTAARAGAALPLKRIDKHTWCAQSSGVAPAASGAKSGPITVTCEVYAWDLSVRAAHLDATHGFFNGTSVFLRVAGREDRRCEVEIVRPAGATYRRWEVATSMPRRRAPAWSFGLYGADDYDELIDHPVEMGTFTRGTFTARGAPHDVAVTGRHRADMPRLLRDMKTVCEQHIDFFRTPAPMKRYLFLVTAVGEGYGGLEHRASTALLCSRNDLPHVGMKQSTDGYRTLLGLISHEYFHTWNVKRIKPAAFTPYDLNRENYTTLLWAFEGITSYYDDLALVRSGLLTHGQYFEAIGRSVTQLLRTPGRRKQSVSDSSFDAWTKYYRQDENSPNAIVSYYGKGSLAALCLDLHIRERTAGRRSLDDVMRALWRRHGLTGAGVTEDGVERVAEAVTGLRLGRQFAAWLRSTAELPLKALLATHGIALGLRPAESAADKGGRKSSRDGAALRARPVLGARGKAFGGEYKLTHVLAGGAAEEAGLAAGDAVIAVDGVRAGAGGLDALLATRRPGERVELHAFRRDELMTFRVTLRAPEADTAYLAVDAAADAVRGSVTRRLRERWLKTAARRPA
ncbi:MAG: M61 family metallopeptidase [Betaproteobacteria bacterium]|nr:M61 family metallopeptidase [Betaproteobacteria bacterium]